MSKPTKIIVSVLMLGLLIAAGIGYSLYNKPHADLSSGKADFTLSASELFQAFEVDETAATQKYVSSTDNEIVLEVTGVIREVKPTSEGGMTMVLEGGDMFGVNCEFLEASAVEPGQEVTVRGYCTGMLMDVAMSRCILISK